MTDGTTRCELLMKAIDAMNVHSYVDGKWHSVETLPTGSTTETL